MPRIKWAAKDIPSKCIALDGRRTLWTFDGVSGLALDCLPNGTRTWRYRYRIWKNGEREEKSYKLGELNPEQSRALGNADQDAVLQPGQARDKALRIAVRVDSGGDPYTEDRAARTPQVVDTFGRVALDWIELHSKPNKRSWREDEKRYKRHVAARLGAVPVAQLTRQQIVTARDDIAKNVGKVEANHVHALISAALKWAVNQGRINTHPAYSLSKLMEQHRDRYMFPDELKAIWDRLDELPDYSADGIRLCLLLGQRSAEIAGMAKTNIILNGNDPHWILPGSSTKNKLEHLVPLPTLAAEIIARNVTDSPFIFPGRTKSKVAKPMVRETLSKPFTKLVRDLKLKNLVLHDSRHTVKTAFAEMGVPVNVSDRVTNQTSGDQSRVGSRYEHYEFRAEKRRALELWERRLLVIVNGQPPSGERWQP